MLNIYTNFTYIYSCRRHLYMYGTSYFAGHFLPILDARPGIFGWFHIDHYQTEEEKETRHGKADPIHREVAHHILTVQEFFVHLYRVYVEILAQRWYLQQYNHTILHSNIGDEGLHWIKHFRDISVTIESNDPTTNYVNPIYLEIKEHSKRRLTFIYSSVQKMVLIVFFSTASLISKSSLIKC